jgi:hypothetical protein
MANYTKATNFAAKDGLPTGDSGKIVKGTEIDTEFTAIASAITSKADSNSPTFTGTPVAPTATSTTNTTQLATTAFVQAAAGRVKQTVTATFNTRSTTTSSSFVNTSVTASITPSSASSKILVLVSTAGYIYNYGNEQNIDIYNGTASVTGSYRINKMLFATEGTGLEVWNPISISLVDSPNTTSAITYTVRQRCTNGTQALVGLGSADTGSSSIILLEILA